MKLFMYLMITCMLAACNRDIYVTHTKSTYSILHKTPFSKDDTIRLTTISGYVRETHNNSPVIGCYIYVKKEMAF